MESKDSKKVIRLTPFLTPESKKLSPGIMCGITGVWNRNGVRNHKNHDSKCMILGVKF